MNKTKITLLAIAGTALAGTLALGFLIYSSWSGKSESDQEIESLEEDANRLASLKVYPSQESVKATDANRKAYDDWYEIAMALASAGDIQIGAKSPASFKADMENKAKFYSELPGLVAGHFVRGDFGFGFDAYIHKPALPPESELSRLQREWYDVCTFIDLLVDARASSVAELSLAVAEVKEEVPAKGKKKAKRKKDAEADAKPDITRFNIVFTASPASLVAVLNGIAANPRFIVAESMSFVRGEDEISMKMGEKSAKKQNATGRRQSRRKTVVEDAETQGAEVLTGVITDPASAPDFKVTMRVAVYDFRTKSAPQEEKEVSK